MTQEEADERIKELEEEISDLKGELENYRDAHEAALNSLTELEDAAKSAYKDVKSRA